jgi:hypothetical protein
MVNLIIASMGLPGGSKSTVLRIVSDLLGDSAIWVNQDEYGRREKYIDIVTRLIRDEPEAQTLCLDKCHHSHKIRQSDVWAWKLPVVWLVFKHPDDTRTSLKKTKELCLNRCLSRTGHRTITTATNATEAVNAIEKQWQALFQDEVNASKKIIEIDITKPISTIITTIFKRLEWPIPEQQKLSAAIEKSKLYERELAASWPRDARA